MDFFFFCLMRRLDKKREYVGNVCGARIQAVLLFSDGGF